VITHEIRKPSPPSLLQRIKRAIVLEEPPPLYTPSQHIVMGGMKCMPKLDYVKWIEEQVKPTFGKGTLCTMKGLAVVPGVIPEPVYEVTDVQEICWHAPIDTNFHQPRCLFIRNIRHPGASTMCPIQLRPLTKVEVDLVHARDKAKQALRDEQESSPSVPDPHDSGDYAG
jgi:hypothetical protein